MATNGITTAGAPGVTQYALHRTFNRKLAFLCTADYRAYLHWLLEYSRKFQVRFHAWVLMDSEVHLLATAARAELLALLLRALAGQYTRHFNLLHGQSGLLWQTSSHGCRVEADSWIRDCYRYIELNPVRADVVQRATDYRWSSCRSNALGRNTALCSPHPGYLRLAQDQAARQMAYRALLSEGVPERVSLEIRDCIVQNRSLGAGTHKVGAGPPDCVDMIAASVGLPLHFGR